MRYSRDSLFLLFVLYYLLNLVRSEGSMYSQFFIVAIVLISGIYFLKTLINKDNWGLFFSAWTFFVLLNIIGFIFSSDLSERQSLDMFKNISVCMLSFYPFYYFAKKGDLKTNHLLRFFFVLLPIIILEFYSTGAMLLYERDIENVVNNRAYLFVSVMPFVFLIKNKKLISGALMIIIMLLIIQGAKRGAIIAGSIGLLVYFYYLLKTIEKSNKYLGYLGVVLTLIALIFFSYKTYLNNEFVLGRMTSVLEGDTSNRYYLYLTIFDKWFYSTNIWNLLFGFGFGGSLEITMGGFAHSDWLELLASFGITGILAYLFLFYAAFKVNIHNKWMIDKKILMLTITIIWFFVSLISMVYTTLYYFTFSILFGYLIGNENKSLD